MQDNYAIEHLQGQSNPGYSPLQTRYQRSQKLTSAVIGDMAVAVKEEARDDRIASTPRGTR